MKYRSTPRDISGYLGLNLLRFTRVRTIEDPKLLLGYSLSRYLAPGQIQYLQFHATKRHIPRNLRQYEAEPYRSMVWVAGQQD